MRMGNSAFPSRRAYQFAFVILLAGMSAACNSSRFNHPLLTGSTDQSTTAPGDGVDQPMPPAPTGDVQRADLPPPPAGTYPTVVAAAPPASATGWTAVGGRVIRVGQNESLDALAGKYGVPREQILSANQLSSAADVRPGRVLVIPVRTSLPPTTTVAAAAPPATSETNLAGTSTYVVQPGDTLFSISRRTGMKPTEIASLNGMGTDAMLHVGQTLRLSGSAATTVASTSGPKVLGAPPKPLGTIVTTTPPKATNPPAVVASTGAQAMPTIPVTKGDDATAASVSAADVDNAVDPGSADGKQFRWPVRGRIISGFGTKPNGEKNDGINLAVPEGTSVKAAETGTVIYAGNELAGYGNLVLIRHADGWVSAYAHNKDMLVKRGDTVRRGQVIAHAGMTGSVSAPQVHFELRKGAKPVNPLDYLAGA